MMRRLSQLYGKLSISTQIISTIILVFISFFVLQIFLNGVFFRNYYVNREIDAFNVHFQTYVSELSTESDTSYHDAMYRFIQEHNVYSVILEQNFVTMPSFVNEYSVTVKNEVTDTFYHVIIFDNHHHYFEGESIRVRLMPYNDHTYVVCELHIDHTLSYSRLCIDDLEPFEASVESVSRPPNLNYLFEQNPLVQSELRRIANNEIRLTDVQFGQGYRYYVDQGPRNAMIFIEPLGDWQYVMVIKQLQSTDEIITVVSAYQNYVYLTAVVIIILWSFRIGTVVSTPIKNIEKTSRQIANLNFDIVADETSNRETASLSESINLISRNLRTTIETINNKNTELVALYKAQTHQSNMRRQLVSSISHELKTPLMIIQVILQAIMDGIIPVEDMQKELQNALEEINTSSLMLQDLLQIYRLDNKDASLLRESVDLGDLTYACFKDLEVLFQSNTLKTNIDLAEGIIIEADPKLIERVLSNYMTNAVKYTPLGETVHIKVYRNQDKAVFDLENEGAHIPIEDLSKVWLPFYRLEAPFEARIKNRSSGIGLYLVGEILDAHHFTYALSNTQKGVRVTFEAPLKK